MTKCTRVEHPSYHLDELRSIRMNMKSNTGYVPTKPGDLPSEALAREHLHGENVDDVGIARGRGGRM